MSSPRFHRSFSIFISLLAFAVAVSQACAGNMQALPRPHYQASRIEYPVVRTARAIAAGDLDGDGNIDLAVADEVSDSVVILSGDRYGAFARAGEYPAGSGPVAIVVGDLNGDGALDIAVADSLGNTVTVLFGPDFQTTTSIPVGLNPTSLALTDIDRNGEPDIVVVNSGSLTLSLLLANGTGGFTRYADRNLNYKAWAVAVGNFDGDEKPDLVVARRSTLLPAIAVLPGRDDYESYLDFAAPPGPYAVATGDLNEDGLDDVVVGTEFGRLSVRLAGTSPWLGPPNDVPLDWGVHGVAIADVNGDGHRDVIACGSQQIFVLLGDGTGHLVPACGLSGPLGSQGLVVADFDRDGRADIAVAASSTVSVHHGNGDGSFGSERFLETPTQALHVGIADVDGDHRADLVAMTSYGACVYPGTADGRLGSLRFTPGPDGVFRLGDMNDDGRADLVAAPYHGLWVWTASAVTPDSFVASGWSDWLGNARRPAIGDVDSDGYADVVVSAYGPTYPANQGLAIVASGNGRGALANSYLLAQGPNSGGQPEIVRWAANPWPQAVVVGSNNSDPESLYVRGENGTLSSSPLDLGIRTDAIAAGDLDGDGITDLVGASQSQVHAVRMTSAPPPAFYSAASPISMNVLGGDDVRIADANGDDIPDIIAMSFRPGALSIVPGAGAWRFEPRTDVLASSWLFEMDTGDLNDDGVADIACVTQEGIELFLSNAAPTPLLDTLAARMLAGGGARITWRVHEPGLMTDVTIQRALPGDSLWTVVTTVPETQADLNVAIDPDAPAGTRPWYRVIDHRTFAAPGPVRAEPANEPPPTPLYTLALAPIRPNPSAGAATIDFTLAAPGHARVDVLDLQGRRVATLVDGALPVGPHSVTWNGHSDAGRTGAGIYFVRLVAGSNTQVRRFARTGGD